MGDFLQVSKDSDLFLLRFEGLYHLTLIHSRLYGMLATLVASSCPSNIGRTGMFAAHGPCLWSSLPVEGSGCYIESTSGRGKA